MKENDIQIIVIPGIMGSVLSHSQYTLFPPIDARDWFRGRWHKKMGDLENQNILATAIYARFYKDLIENSKNIASSVDEFAYDWRKNNIENVEALRQKIITSNAKEVVIIAHSMGGILAKLLLSQENNDLVLKKVRRFITMGTPWYGSIEAYRQLMYGFYGVYGLLKGTIGKFESVYQLLPHQRYIDVVGKKYGASFWNQNCWDDVYKKVYMDLCKKNNVDIEKVLEEFYIKIAVDLPESIEHHEIIGYDYHTLLKADNFLSSVRGQGDKTVPLDSACSNAKYKYFVKCRHQELPNNNIVNRIIQEILSSGFKYEDVKQQFGLLTYEQVLQKDLNFKVVKVACPVNVAILDEGNPINTMQHISKDFWTAFFGEYDTIQYYDDNFELVMETEVEKELRVEAYDPGGVTIWVEEYNKGVLSCSNKFKTFNINSSKVANIKIKKCIDECKVSLNDGESNIDVDSLLVENNYKGLMKGDRLPETFLRLKGQHVQNIEEDKYIATGDVYLSLINIIPGTHRVLDTVFRINEGHKMSLSQEDIKINLKEGSNSIKFYSIDEYNNTERVKKIDVTYYSNEQQRIPNIMLKANPGSYRVDVAAPIGVDFKSNIVFEDGGKSKGVEITGGERGFYVEVDDVLGQAKSNKFLIDEDLLNKFFTSEITNDEFEIFTQKLNIDQYSFKLQFKIANGKSSGWRNKFNYVDFAEANTILIRDKSKKGIEIQIDKIKAYNIMFSNMTEYIDMNTDENYQFEFSVFNTDLRFTITDVNFNVGIFKQDIDDQHQFEQLLLCDTKISDNRYRFEVNTNDLLSNLKEKDIDVNECTGLYLNIYDINNELVASRELVIK